MATPTPTGRDRQTRRPGDRVRIIAGALAAAVLGGVAAVILALALGVVHAGGPATTVIRAPSAASSGRVPEAAWVGVYRLADAGAVDLTVRSTADLATPYGTAPEKRTVIGSGFVVDGRGDIVTAAHVVSGADSITVSFANGATRSGRVLGRDAASDVALVHVDPAGLTLSPLALGSSAALKVGEQLAVVGDPLGFDRSLSTGVVSALDRTIQAPNGFQIAHAIQTDAAMNPGNSGGPLLDAGGRVIGIADQIATGTGQFGGTSDAQTSTGVGFAVPIDLIRHELRALEHGQAVRHAYLGIGAAQTASGGLGVRVGSVEPGSPAAAADLRAGDVIVALDGVRLAGEAALVDALAAAHPGERVRLTVRRGAARTEVSVTLAEQPARAPSSPSP